MIRARQILEAYETSFKNVKNDYVEVFSNPDRKELSSLGEWIRFSANSCNKTVYAWDAHLALHYVAREHARLPHCGENLEYWWTGILDGTAMQMGSSYVMDSSDCFRMGFKEFYDEKKVNQIDRARIIMYSLADILDHDWSWVDRYVKVNGWLQDMRESVDAALESINDKRRVK
jgi:hypothetical protein